MRRHPEHLTNRRGTSLPGFLLVCAAFLLMTQSADAQTRVKPINGSEGVSSVVDGRAEDGDDARANSGFAHLDGPAQHSGSRGLTLAGQRILITNRTSVFPSIDGVSNGIRPHQLSGRELTVYGEITPRGIDAILVIVRPAAGTETDYSIYGEEDQNFEPSATDPRVGRSRNPGQE